jgi:hypothetical protein
MNSMEVEGEEKMGKRSRLIGLYVDWIDGEVYKQTTKG